MKLLCNINFLSSFLFLFPIYYGNKLRCYIISYGSLCCLITSLLHHSIHSNITQIIDRICIIICITYFMLCGFTFTKYYLYTILCLLILILTYNNFIYKNYTTKGYILHSLIHLISNLGIIFLIYGCVEKDCYLLT